MKKFALNVWDFLISVGEFRYKMYQKNRHFTYY